MPATFQLPQSALPAPPRDYLLHRDVCSYGYFILEPNHWDPRTRVLRRVLDLPGGPADLAIAQPGRRPGGRGLWGRGPGGGGLWGRLPARGSPLHLTADRELDAADLAAARAQLTRMLRLDEDHLHVRAFHRLDSRCRASGRARLFRSPTFFEDLIKTVTSCNVTWPSTIAMNRKLCAVYGRKAPSGRSAFPTPAALAAVRPSSLRARCSVGYRDARIVELARLVRSRQVDAAWFEDPARTDDELRAALLELPGIGPYAANNLLQLLGRYGSLPLDSESVRHGRTLLGFRGTDRQVMKKVARHFEPFGEHKFRAYWFEMWSFYEAKRGRSWTWERETTGASFTASQLKASQLKASRLKAWSSR